MRWNWSRGLAAAAICAVALIVTVGCSSSDNGVNSSGLTKEQQYEEISLFVDFFLGSSTSQFGGMFWDGIDEGDFDLGVFPIPGSPKLAVTADSVGMAYDGEKGWWFVTAFIHVDDDTLGMIAITIEDSIRFETIDGTPQLQPDEITTYRFLRGGLVDFSWQLPSVSGGGGFSLSASTSADVTGLTGDVVIGNGTSAASFRVEIASQSEQGHIQIDLTSSFEDIEMSTADGADACPSSGEISGTFSAEIDLTEDGTHVEANEDWSISVVITGPGTAHVSVTSDDFLFESDEDICTPPSL